MSRVSAPEVTVRPLRPALLGDYLAFFDRDAFADFPWWSSCFCIFYRDPAHTGDSSPEKRDEHRPKAIELVRSGEQQGFLAYADGKVVGWCSAGPREGYRAMRRYAAAIDGTPDVGAIMCFVVAAPYRGSGVATALLNAACDGLRDQGMRVVEAYPTTKEPPTEPHPVPWSAHNYHGPLRMFLSNGFFVHRQMDGWVIVRKRVAPDDERHDAEDGM